MGQNQDHSSFRIFIQPHSDNVTTYTPFVDKIITSARDGVCEARVRLPWGRRHAIGWGEGEVERKGWDEATHLYDLRGHVQMAAFADKWEIVLGTERDTCS